MNIENSYHGGYVYNKVSFHLILKDYKEILFAQYFIRIGMSNSMEFTTYIITIPALLDSPLDIIIITIYQLFQSLDRVYSVTSP